LRVTWSEEANEDKVSEPRSQGEDEHSRMVSIHLGVSMQECESLQAESCKKKGQVGMSHSRMETVLSGVREYEGGEMLYSGSQVG